MKTKNVVFLFLVLSFSTTFAKEKNTPQLNFDQSQSVLYDMGNLGKNSTMGERPEMKGAKNSLYGSYLSDDDGLGEIGTGSRFITLKDLVFSSGKTSVVLKNEKYDGFGVCLISLNTSKPYPQVQKKGIALNILNVEKKYYFGKLSVAEIREDGDNSCHDNSLPRYDHSNGSRRIVYPPEGPAARYREPDGLYLLTPLQIGCIAHYFSSTPYVSVEFQIESQGISSIECRRYFPPIDANRFYGETSEIHDESKEKELTSNYLKKYPNFDLTLGEFQRGVLKDILELQFVNPREIQ